MNRFSDILENKNSIGFLRLLSAWLVVIGHSVPFGKFGEDSLILLTNNQLAIGRFPVDVFFALSGFLIFSSYDRLNNLSKFLWFRFLRIYPAFIVCISLTAFILPLIIGFNIDLNYFISNFTLILIRDSSIGEIGLSNNVNSALWTLPWELKAYILIAILGFLKILNYKWIIPSLLFVFYSLFIFQIISSPETLETGRAITSGSRLLTFFLIGATFYLFRKNIVISNKLFILSILYIITSVILGCLFYNHSAGLYYIFCPIPFTYIVFYLSYVIPFNKINTKTDISYGVYIYGSIVLNLLTFYHFNKNYWIYLSITILITSILSYLSWILIEKKCLRLKTAFIK